MKGYSEGSYKFTVKAYTSAGEDTGATASIVLKQQGMWNTHDSTKNAEKFSVLCKIVVGSLCFCWQMTGWSWKSWLLLESRHYFWSLSPSFATRNGNGKTDDSLMPLLLHFPQCRFFRLPMIIHFVSAFCFMSRVKRALYPDIPEPKLPGNWSRTQV